MKKNNSVQEIKRLVAIALFCAIAYAVTFVFRFKISFLTFDAKDAVITIAGLLFGPISSIIISLIVALIEMFTVSETGIYGFIMNFISSAVFSGVCSLIYKYKKNVKGAFIGLGASVLSVTAVMMILNITIIPLYMPVTASDVVNMIPKLLLPFNLTKAILNSAITLLLYKPISRAFKAAKVINYTENSSNATAKQSKLNTIIVSCIAILLAAISIFVFIILLNGKFSFH